MNGHALVDAENEMSAIVPKVDMAFGWVKQTALANVRKMYELLSKISTLLVSVVLRTNRRF